MRGGMRGVHAWVLATCVGLSACGTSRHTVGRQYAQTVDSASNACQRAPHLCSPEVGEQLPVVPPARPPPPTPRPMPAPRPPLAGAQATALNLGAAAVAIRVVIDATLELRIRKALVECADDARSQMILKHFENGGPTREQCNEVLSVDADGQPFTRAMQLGREQHAMALECARQLLEELKPGGFTLSPRYRYDPSTGHTEYIPPDEVEALLAQGRYEELRGTLEPDVVIHLPGHPGHIQMVLDFKFPCLNGGRSGWREYQRGPYKGRFQNELYSEAFKTTPWLVLPRWGAFQ